jgi:tRNA nucleotidyltransferase (CCA-adding enzyme)
LKKCFFRIKKIQGSRTYYQVKKGDYIFEIIPVIEIENPEEALNIMDISPLHVNWVNHNAKNIKDEIRKAKSYFVKRKLIR